ncbi:YciI family protein [Gaiella sp.]|uniref:YciI family protein n=1 Tax=Gaiella sp. TaxID=2663207 RepID=UPI0032656FF4
MKYAMLVYSDQASWEGLSDEEAGRLRAESMPRWITLFDEMGKADPNVTGKELAGASEAKVVRVVDGQTIVTDGPFAETKEQLGGVFITELPDLDEAIRLAALVPAADYGTLEIRPLATR